MELGILSLVMFLGGLLVVVVGLTFRVKRGEPGRNGQRHPPSDHWRWEKIAVVGGALTIFAAIIVFFISQL